MWLKKMKLLKAMRFYHSPEADHKPFYQYLHTLINEYLGMKTSCLNNNLSSCVFFRFIMICILIIPVGFNAHSQCPPNLDFETGTFDGWISYSGIVAAIGGQNVIALEPASGPIPNQQTMLSSFPGDGLDEYGGFPKNCPNGSGHSIKLGNKEAGGFAEGLSYDFTIPATANKFSITYNYAVVFQDPGHNTYEQPRLEIEILNITDNTVVNCFSFSYIADEVLPGFITSPIHVGDAPVLYKGWTANTVNLYGYEGKTIRFFVKTADCTYAVHFGYAYIDVTSKCEGTFTGSVYCPGDTAVNIVAPYGYKEYKWFNNAMTQVLGTAQVLHISPPPPSGTMFPVELIPFPGYGCKDTIVTQVFDTLSAVADAGPDVASCNFNPVQLGSLPLEGMKYSWSPSIGLDNADISNPRALPPTDTTYVLTVSTESGGCIKTDTVHVTVRNLNDELVLVGNAISCRGQAPPVLKVQPTDSVHWYRDGISIPGANQLQYTVTETGVYFAKLFSNICSQPLETRWQAMTVDTARAGITYPELDAVFNFPLQLHAREFGISALWSPAVNLDNPSIYTPFYKGVNPQLYTVEIKTATGCRTVDTQMVKTHKKIDIYVPTMFTPDDDGNNDYLRPLLFGFKKVNYFRVYNRWGRLLFETKSDRPGWNGKINGLPQETQTVIWMLDAEDVDGKNHKRHGTSILMH